MDRSGARGRELLPASRSQSETLGFVLVFTIMLLGALVVVALGAYAISDTQDEIGDDRAEQALTQFDAQASLVALGEADSQRISFASDDEGDFHVREDRGWMNVTVENQTNGNVVEVMNVTLGALTYEGGSETMAYQGGGVWQATDRGGQMISPPEFHFRNGTLTLPAINVSGDFDLRSSVDITQGVAEQTFPTQDGSFVNPLDNHLVTVTVQSDYYRGWGQYFEQRTDGEVAYPDGIDEAVELTLVSPLDDTAVTSAAASLAAEGDFTVNGAPASTCGNPDRFTDSYNSTGTDLDYCEQLQAGETGNRGDVIYGGDIDIDSGGGGADFCGNLVAGGSVEVSSTGGNDGPNCGEGSGGQPTIYGNINYTTDCTDCEGAIADTGADYEVNRISGLNTAAPIDWHIENKLETIEEDADEHNPTDDELDAGAYYFDELVLSGSDEELELNTTGGNIDIAVREYIRLVDGATINVTGNNQVNVFLAGYTQSGHLLLGNDAAITNPDHNGTQFKINGKSNFTAQIGQGGAGSLAKFVGVIYAPPGNHGDGQVVLNGGEIMGGLVTGTTVIPDGGTGSIHYDEALEHQDAVSPGAKVIKLTYLHTSVNEIRID